MVCLGAHFRNHWRQWLDKYAHQWDALFRLYLPRTRIFHNILCRVWILDFVQLTKINFVVCIRILFLFFTLFIHFPYSAVYVLLSLNVASVIYCFEDTDEHKGRAQEADYREARKVFDVFGDKRWQTWSGFSLKPWSSNKAGFSEPWMSNNDLNFESNFSWSIGPYWCVQQENICLDKASWGAFDQCANTKFDCFVSYDYYS